MGATRTSCMIALILAGAAFLSPSMGFTGLPRALAGWIASLHLDPVTLLVALMVFYIVTRGHQSGLARSVEVAASTAEENRPIGALSVRNRLDWIMVSRTGKLPDRENVLSRDMASSLQPSDLDDRIVDLVRECWEEHGIPLLLSRLGGEDDGRIARFAKQEASSLGAYLRHRLDTRVRVIHHSSKPTVAGAIPTDVAAGVNGDFDMLLERTHSQSPRTIPRYHPAFWAAFRKPLDESNGRYVSVQPPLRFQDTLPEHKPDGFVEITREYVLGPDAEVAEVQQRIQDWLAANKLDPAPFLLKNEANIARLPSDDLLGRLLLALEPDELKRISMPLDVVSKLRRQPL